MELSAARSGVRKIALALIGSLLIAAVIIIYSRANPITSPFYPPCPFHTLTGLYCPGCGTGRAIYHLLHGQLVTAFFFNPLMIVCLPYLAYTGLLEIMRFFSPYQLPMIRIRAHWTKWIPAVIIAYWILRNIPLYPFTLIAPHYVGH